MLVLELSVIIQEQKKVTGDNSDRKEHQSDLSLILQEQ